MQIVCKYHVRFLPITFYGHCLCSDFFLALKLEILMWNFKKYCIFLDNCRFTFSCKYYFLFGLCQLSPVVTSCRTRFCNFQKSRFWIKSTAELWYWHYYSQDKEHFQHCKEFCCPIFISLPAHPLLNLSLSNFCILNYAFKKNILF